MKTGTDSLVYSEAEVERWDREWLNYLLTQYPQQLTPFHAYPDRPELTEDPIRTIDLSVGNGGALLVYAPDSAIRDKFIMEFGCGCGNLGKLISAYARGYLGVDCSPLALSIARLVSPENATYIHVNDKENLERFYGTVDTLLSRFFWIHQNFETGRRVLRIVEPFFKAGSRLYLDFFWPNPQEAVGFWRTAVDRVRKPQSSLDTEPSAMFQYSAADVEELFKDTPFRVIHQLEHGPTQRRYVTAERTA